MLESFLLMKHEWLGHNGSPLPETANANYYQQLEHIFNPKHSYCVTKDKLTFESPLDEPTFDTHTPIGVEAFFVTL